MHEPSDWTGDTVLAWLLEPEDPPVRHAALTDLLGRAEDDPEVCEAKAAIPGYPPVAALLAVQQPDGRWGGRNYYLPKHQGTFWALCILADLGLTAEEPHVQRACEYIFGHQRADGAFRRQQYLPKLGWGWGEPPEPCTHARILRFLVQFGYGADPRAAAGIAWLLLRQRDDAMWLCDRGRGRGCLRATLDYLRLAAVHPLLVDIPATRRAAGALCDLLMARGMGRYHVGEEWRTLAYPYFGYSVISALDALALLGYTYEHPKIAEAINYLLSRRLPDGRWPLDAEPQRPPFSFGQAGTPNKWLTLDALRAMRTCKPWM